MSFHTYKAAGVALALFGAWFYMISQTAAVEPLAGAKLHSYPRGTLIESPNHSATGHGFTLSHSDNGSPVSAEPIPSVRTNTLQNQEYASTMSDIPLVEDLPHGYEQGLIYQGNSGAYTGSTLVASRSATTGRGRPAANALGHFFPTTNQTHPTTNWFDIYVGTVFLDRDFGVGRVDFAADGIGNSNIVLSTDDLGLDDQPGLQLTMARLIGPGRSIEGNYVGMVEWKDNASANSANHNLYSVLSGFGTNPSPPIAGFLHTDQATRQDLSYNSQFHSIDLILRQRYVARNFRFAFSKSAGIRFVSLGDDLRYHTDVESHNDPFSDPAEPITRGPASLDYTIQTDNDMLGFQLGGSAEWNVRPRFRLGSEIRAGLYQNFSDQNTQISSTRYIEETGLFEEPFTVYEKRSVEEHATIVELNMYATFQLSARCTLRVGYYMLHLAELVLAAEQFDPDPAFIFPPRPDVPRTPGINNDSDLLLSGLTSGIEWTW